MTQHQEKSGKRFIFNKRLDLDWCFKGYLMHDWALSHDRMEWKWMYCYIAHHFSWDVIYFISLVRKDLREQPLTPGVPPLFWGAAFHKDHLLLCLWRWVQRKADAHYKERRVNACLNFCHPVEKMSTSARFLKSKSCGLTSSCQVSNLHLTSGK